MTKYLIEVAPIAAAWPWRWEWTVLTEAPGGGFVKGIGITVTRRGALRQARRFARRYHCARTYRFEVDP